MFWRVYFVLKVVKSSKGRNDGFRIRVSKIILVVVSRRDCNGVRLEGELLEGYSSYLESLNCFGNNTGVDK